MDETRATKEIGPKEKEFVELMVTSGLGAIEAARQTLGWRCEPGSREAQKAQDLARSRRCLIYRKEYEEHQLSEAKAKLLIQHSQGVDLDKLRDLAYKKLLEIATDTSNKSQTRFTAVKALEDLTDPTKDVALILKWITLGWRGLNAHCPACHNSFPLWKVKNQVVNDYIEEVGDPIKELEGTLERRLEVLSKADNRKTPHPSQLQALGAPERHIVGTWAARSGKSYLLAMLAFLTLMNPGVEVWILARIYEDARSEIEYLRSFIRTAFHPFGNHIIKEAYDAKTGELTLSTKWGSELRIRSAKSKGSITGRELEMALIAEPGWVHEDIFNHLRARMSSRLGRIVLLGTPQGFGGILGRMVNMIGRDPKTNKIVRIAPEDRTLAAGCSWNISMLYFKLAPDDNPEYVKSELGAARMELMDDEYASEFAGEMAGAEGALFPQIKPRHLLPIPRSLYQDCAYVLGVDQGPKNFASVVVGWDGTTAKVAFENYDPEPRTMKSKMYELREAVPVQLRKMGANSDYLRLTIFDTDPPLTNELREMEQEGKSWITPFTFKHRNLRSRHMQENWRKETYEFVNELAVQGRIIFDAEQCYLLHDDLMRVQRKLANENMDVDRGFGKGWEVNNPWRKDHVLDAFILAMWTIMTGQVKTVKEDRKEDVPFGEAKKAFRYQFANQERKELAGFAGYGNYTPTTANELFEEIYGRPRDPEGDREMCIPPMVGPYKDY